MRAAVTATGWGGGPERAAEGVGSRAHARDVDGRAFVQRLWSLVPRGPGRPAPPLPTAGTTTLGPGLAERPRGVPPRTAALPPPPTPRAGVGLSALPEPPVSEPFRVPDGGRLSLPPPQPRQGGPLSVLLLRVVCEPLPLYAITSELLRQGPVVAFPASRRRHTETKTRLCQTGVRGVNVGLVV